MPCTHSVNGVCIPHVLGNHAKLNVESCQLPGASIEGLLRWEEPFSMGPSGVTVLDWLQHCGQGLVTCGHRSPGGLKKCRFRFRRSGVGLRTCISNRLPGERELVLGPYFL